jgi:hypothetical protein
MSPMNCCCQQDGTVAIAVEGRDTGDQDAAAHDDTKGGTKSITGSPRFVFLAA